MQTSQFRHLENHPLQFYINPWQIFANNEIRTSFGWLVAKINALEDGHGVISDCYRTLTSF